MPTEAWEHRAVIRGYELAAKTWDERGDAAEAERWRRLAKDRRKEIQPSVTRKT